MKGLMAKVTALFQHAGKVQGALEDQQQFLEIHSRFYMGENSFAKRLLSFQ